MYNNISNCSFPMFHLRCSTACVKNNFFIGGNYMYMFYPEDFKKRVKETFPKFEKLHRVLDNGSLDVGLYLRNLMQSASISNDTILAATSLEELQKMAKVAETRSNLYNEWCKLYNEQYD